MATAPLDKVPVDSVSRIPAGDQLEHKFKYPGIPTTCDGAEAVVWVETRISQGSGAYPITSSTTMGGGFNAAMMNGVPNLWGDLLVFVEPESEHSAATFCEGFKAGGRVTNFTSGQGLVLMKEVLYTISGKRLPVVFNIGARADQPGAERPRRTRRRDERGRLRMGRAVRSQRPGSGRFVFDLPPRRRGQQDAVLERAGRVPYYPHR